MQSLKAPSEWDRSKKHSAQRLFLCKPGLQNVGGVVQSRLGAPHKAKARTEANPYRGKPSRLVWLPRRSAEDVSTPGY